MLSALVCTGKFYLSTAPRHTHTHTCSQNREERSRKEEPILMTTAAPGWAQTALSVLYVELHLVSQQQELTLLKACFLLFHQPHSSSAADRTNSYKITSSLFFSQSVLVKSQASVCAVLAQGGRGPDGDLDVLSSHSTEGSRNRFDGSAKTSSIPEHVFYPSIPNEHICQDCVTP